MAARRLMLAAMVAVALAPAASAGPPPVADLAPKAAGALLTRVMRATVAAVYCGEAAFTQSQWKFLADTADRLANRLGLDSAGYEARYYDPAHAAFDAEPEFCATEAPRIPVLIEELVGMGGRVDKYKPGA